MWPGSESAPSKEQAVGAAPRIGELHSGVSRQSVHTWLVRYRQEGIARLEDRGTPNPAPAPGVDQHLSGPSRATKR
jgi:leucine-zipper of insertion element IS481